MASISFSVLHDQPATVSLYNSQGECIRVLYRDVAFRGEHVLRVDCGNLPAGVYLVTLETKEGAESMKMSVVR
ncbi:MAG: T9SS type A sorting domain-containing protein [Ignavibacteria bacterium]|nr:T9SS type A sorting domain-containing protein [Ignavibacteria bacterium]